MNVRISCERARTARRLSPSAALRRRPRFEVLEQRCLLTSVPVAVADLYEATALEPLIVTDAVGVLANDDHDQTGPLAAMLVSPPEHGQLALDPSGAFRYTTFGNYGGTDQFTYRAVAGDQVSDKVAVVVQVNQLPDVPVAVNDRFRVAEDTTLVADRTPLFSVQTLDLAAQQIVYDPMAQRLYALVDQDLVPIDPETGRPGQPARVGDDPQRMAISDDGHYIHLVTNDGRSIRRFNTQTAEVDLQWDVGDFSRYGVAIGDIEAVPGRPTAVAVAQYYPHFSPRQGGIVIFDNGVRLPEHTAGGLGTSPGGDAIAFATEDTLVGYTNSLSSYELTVMRVDEQGVRVERSVPGALSGNMSIVGGGGYVYSTHGTIVELATMRARGNLPVRGAVLPDPTEQRVFVLHGDGPTTAVSWFAPATRDRLGYLTVPGVVGEISDPVRFGEEGLAFRTSEDKVVIVQADKISGNVRQGVVTNDADPDGDPLLVTLQSDVQHGFLALSDDGTFQYRPNSDFVGTDSFTYQVSDGTHLSNVATATLQVLAVNDSPIAQPDSFSVDEDAVLTVAPSIGLVSNDRDIDSTRLTATITSRAQHGTVQLQPDGSFAYTPQADFAGIDTFTYRAHDGEAFSNEATVTINVREMNELPVPVDDHYHVNEDGVLRIDGNPFLSVSVVQQPAADLVYDAHRDRLLATVPPSGGPQANMLVSLDPYTGERDQLVSIGQDPRKMVVSKDGHYLYAVVQDERAVQVHDLETGQLQEKFFMPGTGRSAERVRNIHPIPGRPDDLLITRYYRSYSSSAGTWVYTNEGETLPDHVGQGTGTGGPDITVLDETGTKAFGYQNSVSSFDFWYMAVDDRGVHQTDQYLWGSVLSGYNVGEMQVADGKLLTNRGEVVDLATRERIGSFAGGSNFVVAPENNQWFSLQADDTSAMLRVYDLETLDLVDSVEIPGITADTASLVRFGQDGVAFRTLENGQPAAIVLVQSSTVSGLTPSGVGDNDRDVDGNAARFTLVEDAQHGMLTLNEDGTFTYYPETEFSGTDQFRYRIVSDQHQSHVATATITVRQVNDRPQAQDDEFQINEDSTLNIPAARGVLANDSDIEGDPIQAGLVTAPAHGTLELAADGSLTYHPQADFFGRDNFQYVATDENGDSRPASATIEVAAAPDPTLAADDTYVMDQGRTLVADSPGPIPTDPTAWTLVSGEATWRYLDDGSDQGALWRDPAYDDSGWQAGPAPLGYGEGNEATVVSYGSDPDNKHLTTYFRHSFQVENTEGLRQLTLGVRRDDGVAVYLNGVEIARDNLSDNAAFDERAISSSVDDGRGPLTFDVDSELLRDGVNVLAAEVHQRYHDSTDITFEGRLTATLHPRASLAGVLANDRDADGERLQAMLVAPAQHGRVTLEADGTFAYEPELSFTGTDRFVYQASDGFGEDGVATVSIQVEPANIPPMAKDDTYELSPTGELTVDAATGVLANDEDVQNMELSATLVDGPSFGTVSLSPDGSFVYTPGPEFYLFDHFTYMADDGELQSAAASVTIRLQAPSVVVSQHALRPNTPDQTISLLVSGGQSVSGLNLFAQVGDGGPELAALGLEPGNDGPAITDVDLKTGTIFADAPDVPFVDLTIPQAAYATISMAEPGGTTRADGLLATLTVDTTGLYGGTFDLRLSGVLPGLDNGPFSTSFSEFPIHVTNGTLEVVSAEVVGRHVFYNHSTFDGQNRAASRDDDTAIATDKSALLPGQTAIFANYTSYSRGLNGIMIDVHHLLGTPQNADFDFRVGNSSRLDQWQPGPTPSTITVRPGEGGDGSDRISLIWHDGAIADQWLEVTMRSSSNTGLFADDVFYFGNAVGESGDSPTNALVNATDVIRSRDNPRGPFDPASITNPYDFNRDRMVTATDVILARDHVTSPFSALQLINPVPTLGETAPGLRAIAPPFIPEVRFAGWTASGGTDTPSARPSSAGWPAVAGCIPSTQPRAKWPAINGPADRCPYQVGDANRDHRFDRDDVVQILQAGKYLASVDAAWETGDWNGDGRFDQHDIVAALRIGNYTAQSTTDDPEDRAVDQLVVEWNGPELPDES